MVLDPTFLFFFRFFKYHFCFSYFHLAVRFSKQRLPQSLATGPKVAAPCLLSGELAPGTGALQEPGGREVPRCRWDPPALCIALGTAAARGQAVVGLGAGGSPALSPLGSWFGSRGLRLQLPTLGVGCDRSQQARVGLRGDTGLPAGVSRTAPQPSWAPGCLCPAWDCCPGARAGLKGTGDAAAGG